MPSPKETALKLPPSIETSLVFSLTTSDDAIARYCMQLLRKQYPWVSRYPHGVAGEGVVGVCDPGASRWYNIWYRGEGV